MTVNHSIITFLLAAMVILSGCQQTAVRPGDEMICPGKPSIEEAIKAVMREQNQPLTAKDAYAAIVERGLYEFHAQNPEHIVRTQIRRVEINACVSVYL